MKTSEKHAAVSKAFLAVSEAVEAYKDELRDEIAEETTALEKARNLTKEEQQAWLEKLGKKLKDAINTHFVLHSLAGIKDGEVAMMLNKLVQSKLDEVIKRAVDKLKYEG